MDDVASGDALASGASGASVRDIAQAVAFDFGCTDVTDMAQVKKVIAKAKKDKGGRSAKAVTGKVGRGDGDVKKQEYTVPGGRRVAMRAKKRTPAKEKRDAAIIKHAEKVRKILPGKKLERKHSAKAV